MNDITQYDIERSVQSSIQDDFNQIKSMLKEIRIAAKQAVNLDRNI